MENSHYYKSSISLSNPVVQAADMPYALYQSLQGKYFVGYADNMEFKDQNTAWAGLVNPVDSKVNLHVYVWTVTNIGKYQLTARVWFNSAFSGYAFESQLVTPANTAFRPLPAPKVKLLQANNASNKCKEGTNIFIKKVSSEVTIANDEEGALIFPPGGSFIISLSNSEISKQSGEGRVAFGWYEEKI